MRKILIYELKRLLWNRFFLGILLVLLFAGWQVLSGVTLLGVAHTAPFSPWSFGDYLSRMLPLLWIGALFFLIPFVLTQFMLNRSVSAVFVPICLLTSSALGANPVGLVLLVNAGSLTAFLTPMATPAVPMCMADGGYDLRAIFKSGALITLILPFIYIFYTMTVFPAF